MRVRSKILAIFCLLAASLLANAPAVHAGSSAEGCAPTAKSPLVLNVKDKGAKGDGATDDTASIQAAIDEVAGTGGTVLVPDGTYMVEVAPRPRLSLKSDMTLKLAENAMLKAIPTDDEKSAVLTIAGVSNVAVVGGTLEGERDEHKGKKDKRGGWGMGLYIRDGAEHIVIAGVTARKMWADGFYVSGASDVKFCDVTADNNRRQGLSIIEADGLVVTNSVFKNTAGTRPGAGIDFEPDEHDQAITNVKIENSKFIDNVGPGILIAGKKGTVAKIELTRNMFKGNRPILAEDAPEVLASSICGNRQVMPEATPSAGLNAYADTVAVMVHQNDCEDGADMRFEVTREKHKRSK